MNFPSATSPQSTRYAWFIWGILLLVIIILVAHEPDNRTVTHHYRHAAEHWWAGKDLYTKHNMHGFLYLPQAAMFYTPFTLPPKIVGELLWRITSIASFAWAIWRLAKYVSPSGINLWFLVSLLAIPASLSSARNGQFNMPLGALMIFAGLDLADKKWNWTVFWLAIAFLIKPLAIVMILLVVALYPQARWKMLAAFFIVMLLPFLHPDWSYVLRQFNLAAEMLKTASQPDENNFCDLAGFLRELHFNPSDSSMMVVRAIAALGTLGVCWYSLKKFASEKWNALLLTALSLTYLMVFNPRAETNSYVMLSPIIATFTVYEWAVAKNKNMGIFLMILALGLGCDNYPLHRMTNIWLKPLLATIFLGYVVWTVFSTRRDELKALQSESRLTA